MDKRREWQKHIDGWERSGLSQRRYCAREGLELKSFGYWRRQMKEKREKVGEFVEIVARSEERFELELSGGRRLRVPEQFDAKSLQRLLEVLDC